MLGSISTEREVKVAASEAWKLYGTLRLTKILKNGLPHLFSKIDILEGDGSVGTIIHVFFQPVMILSMIIEDYEKINGTIPVETILITGMAGPLKSYKEKFTAVDNRKRVKVAETVEGGYLDLGFNLYRARVEVIEKEDKENECTTKITIEYQLKHEAAANASLVSIEPFIACLQVVADYLHENDNNSDEKADLRILL